MSLHAVMGVTLSCPWLPQVINTRLESGAPELWEQVVDFDTKRVLRPGHYVVDRKQQRVSLTTEGMHAVLRRLGERAASLNWSSVPKNMG